MKKLYEIQAEYFEAYDRAIDWITMGCTLKECIEDIGFNNITLFNPFEEDDKKDIKNIYYNSNIYNKLTVEMLKTKVKLSSTYEDSDGFLCVNVFCENDEDFKKFEKLLKKEN